MISKVNFDWIHTWGDQNKQNKKNVRIPHQWIIHLSFNQNQSFKKLPLDLLQLQGDGQTFIVQLLLLVRLKFYAEKGQ